MRILCVAAVGLAAALSGCMPDGSVNWAAVGAAGEAMQGAGAALRPLDHPGSSGESLEPSKASGLTCFGKGETVSGMNKICLYDCLGSGTAITIAATSLCPLTIQR